MKDIRVDSDGQQRCWNCGGRTFTHKRTARSKVAVGVGALVTRKKLQCQTCHEYNDTGSAKPWTGPADEKLARRVGTVEAPPAPATPHPLAATPGALTAEMVRLGELRNAGVITEAEYEVLTARLLGR